MKRMICLHSLIIVQCLFHIGNLHSQVKPELTIHRDPVKMKRLAKFKFELLEKINVLEEKHVGVTIQNIVQKFKR